MKNWKSILIIVVLVCATLPIYAIIVLKICNTYGFLPHGARQMLAAVLSIIVTIYTIKHLKKRNIIK
jgi:hypothetical protein